MPDFDRAGLEEAMEDLLENMRVLADAYKHINTYRRNVESSLGRVQNQYEKMLRTNLFAHTAQLRAIQLLTDAVYRVLESMDACYLDSITGSDNANPPVSASEPGSVSG